MEQASMVVVNNPWQHIERFREMIVENGWQVRYDQNGLLIVRVPPTMKTPIGWLVLSRGIAPTVTGHWWLTAPPKAQLRAWLEESLPAQKVREILI